MYFGWVTPLLFALIARALCGAAGSTVPRGVNWVLAGSFGAALTCYPLFLAFGYAPVAIGPKRLPVSVIGSTSNMFAWYGFAVWYVRASRGMVRTQAVALWDAAVVFMVLSTFAAFTLALLKPLGIQDSVWTTALTHVFLDYFSEGWFVLAVLGLLFTQLDPARKAHWSVYLLCAGLPVTFALGMPSVMVPAELRVLARRGGAAVTVGLLMNAGLLGRRASECSRWVWLVPMALLATKALGQLAGSVLPGV